MTGITFRKDGRYSIRIMRNGERIQKYARTYAEAKKILVALKRPKLENNNSLTLGKWLEEWFNVYKKPFLSKKTANNLNNYVNEIASKLGNLKLDRIETIELQNFLNKYPKSRKKEMITLYLIASLKKANETNKTKNTSYLGIVKDKKIKAKRNALTYEQQVRLVEAIKDTALEQPIMFYLMTGARKNELIKNIEDISRSANIIMIHGTKTEKSLLRNVRVTEKYKNYLLKFMEQNKMLSAEWVIKLYAKLCKEINIPSGLHILRHTFATNMRVMGIDAKQTQQWLGHEDVTTTLNIYTDIDETVTRERLISLYNDMYIRSSQQG